MYKSGEIIKTIAHQIFGRPYMFHYGVILVEDDEVYVLHNGRERGVVKETLDKFLKNREVYEIESSNLERFSNKEILLRFEHCKSNWDVLNFNCEHFVDCMTNRNRNSEQLLKFIVFSTLVVLIIKMRNE